jgi:cell division protein FtsB
VNRLRGASRIGIACVALALIAFVAAQYARAIGRNFTLSADLARTRLQIADLEQRRGEQIREIRRLHDPAGAIPEIHDRLHLVGPNETLIFVRGVPTPAPTP